jgi:ATP-dependent DNA ligase
LASPFRLPQEGPQWAYEIKHDGFRFVCRREGERVRHGRDWTKQVPRVTEALAAQPVSPATLDEGGIKTFSSLVLFQYCQQAHNQ